MKILLDTNVLVAAFIAHGTCAELLEHCALKHDIVLSEFILEEFFRVLSVKLRFPIEKIRAAIMLLRSKAIHVEPRPLEDRVCPDPDDAMIIATAIAGKVECLVTGDRELLELRVIDGIRVISPSDFWRFESELEKEAGVQKRSVSSCGGAEPQSQSTMNETHESFWEDEEKVRQFADKDPDRRLLELLPQFEMPSKTRVLDLGCAGGRNTVVLAQRGFDFYAVDSSEAMIRKTRERVEEIVGQQEASRRVNVGTMDDLSVFPSKTFHLVVAFGIYHNAGSVDEWQRAVAETARVLQGGGRLVVSHFSPRCDPGGTGLRPVEGEQNVYEGFGAGRHYFVDAEELDRAMAREGLEPAIPTDTVIRKTENGRRVTVNALYVKRGV